MAETNVAIPISDADEQYALHLSGLTQSKTLAQQTLADTTLDERLRLSAVCALMREEYEKVNPERFTVDVEILKAAVRVINELDFTAAEISTTRLLSGNTSVDPNTPTPADYIINYLKARSGIEAERRPKNRLLGMHGLIFVGDLALQAYNPQLSSGATTVLNCLTRDNLYFSPHETRILGLELIDSLVSSYKSLTTSFNLQAGVATLELLARHAMENHLVSEKLKTVFIENPGLHDCLTKGFPNFPQQNQTAIGALLLSTKPPQAGWLEQLCDRLFLNRDPRPDNQPLGQIHRFGTDF